MATTTELFINEVNATRPTLVELHEGHGNAVCDALIEGAQNVTSHFGENPPEELLEMNAWAVNNMMCSADDLPLELNIIVEAMLRQHFQFRD